MRELSRRNFMRGLALGAIGTALAACAPKVVEVTREVEKVVEKEKVVEQTIVVEKEKEVTKVVKETVVVEAEPAPVEKVPIKVLDAWGPGPWTLELYSAWATGLAENVPGAAVEFIPTLTGEVSTQKTAALLAAGTPPDVTLGSDIRFAFEGVILDLKPLFDLDTEIQGWEWNPPSWDFVNIVDRTGGEIIWAFPGNSDARILYVNMDMCEEAGVTIDPKNMWDWEEFRDACVKLTKRASDGTPEQLAFNGFGTWYGDLYVFANYNGADFWEIDPMTDWVVKSTIDSPECIEAIEYWYKLLTEDKVGPLVGEDTIEGMNFLSGRIAISPSWSSFFSSLNKAQKDGTLNFNYELMGYPVRKKGDKWPNQFANGSQMGSILKASPYPEQSFQVLKYVAGPKGHLVRQRAMGAPPSILNAEELWDEWLTPPPQNTYLYREVMSQGKIGTWSKIKYDADKLSKIYSNEMDNLKAGNTTPAEFARTVAEQQNQIIEEAYQREEG
jgi:ABC-type glycerol-3-phosphate transport system substrate-binding protein